MGFFDFLKKIAKKEELETEKIEFQDLDNWIKDKKEENKNKETEFLGQINTKIKELIDSLKEKVGALETIDISEKKVEERAKLIVKENLRNYLIYLEKLIERLEDFDEKDIDTFINKLNTIFSDFEKKSHLCFEKATYLIGKELGGTRDAIVNFSCDFKNIVNNNKNLIQSSKIISNIELKLNESSNIKDQKERVNKQTQEITSKIVSCKNNLKILEKEIDKIKDSDDYNQELAKKHEITKKKQGLEQEIYSLKAMIDFKYLASIFHANEKEMAIIKDHKENFLNSFQRDDGETLLSILQNTKMEKQDIENKIKSIIENKKKIEESENNLPNKESKNLTHNESEIAGFKKQIFELTNELSREEKKYEKFEEKIKEIFQEIKQESTKINIEIE